MKLSKTTYITLTPNTYLSCLSSEETVNLYLNGKDESVAIQFIPENLPTLKILVAALEELEWKLHQSQLRQLQHQIDVMQNGNRKLTTVMDSGGF